MSNLFNKNFFVRLISSIFMVGIGAFALIKGGFIYSLLVLLIMAICYFEWIRIVVSNINNSDSQKLINYPKYLGFWGVLGMVVILPFAISMLYLRFGQYTSPGQTVGFIFFLVAVLAATDIGAYIFGRLIGGPKLAVNISPNKTISGALMGVVCAMVVGIILNFLLKMNFDLVKTLIFSAILSILSQISGLMISKFKRHFNVKDSSNLIPGHGGFLDRVDSFIIAAPVFVIVLIMKCLF